MDLMMKWRTFIYLFRIAVHFEFDACKKNSNKVGAEAEFSLCCIRSSFNNIL